MQTHTHTFPCRGTSLLHPFPLFSDKLASLARCCGYSVIRIHMAVGFSVPIADLKLVWLQHQTAVSKPESAVLYPVQTLQSTLVSPYGEWPTEKVRQNASIFKQIVRHSSTVAHLSSRSKSFQLGLGLPQLPYQKHLYSTLTEDSCRDSSAHGLIATLSLFFLKTVSHSSKHLTRTGFSLHVKSVTSYGGELRDKPAIVASQTWELVDFFICRGC